MSSPLEAAADAMASGDRFAIGGYVKMPSGNSLWFSQQWIMEDMAFTNLGLSNDAQAYIASFETLAQIALLHCASTMVSFGRLRIRVKSWSDNSGAESVSNKLYTVYQEVSAVYLRSKACFVQCLFFHEPRCVSHSGRTQRRCRYAFSDY